MPDTLAGLKVKDNVTMSATKKKLPQSDPEPAIV